MSSTDDSSRPVGLDEVDTLPHSDDVRRWPTEYLRFRCGALEQLFGVEDWKDGRRQIWYEWCVVEPVSDDASTVEVPV